MNGRVMEECGHSMTRSKKPSRNLPPDEEHQDKPDKIPGLNTQI
jgi:hypothetical protein